MVSSYILIVEDDVFVLLTAAQSLRDAGYAVVEAETADAAHDIVRENLEDIALVFTDIETPGRLDGLSLAWAVRARCPKTPVVVTSGRISPPAGALPSVSYFVPKPYSLDQVSALIGVLAGAGDAGHRIANPSTEP